MTVFVIADTDDKDLLFKVACPVKGLSETFRLKGKADSIAHNPYIVYGSAVAVHCMANSHSFELVVAHVRSGTLKEQE